jgi:hypothetical protein
MQRIGHPPINYSLISYHLPWIRTGSGMKMLYFASMDSQNGVFIKRVKISGTRLVSVFMNICLTNKGKWDDVIPWLSPSVIKECLGLWQARLSDVKFEQLKLRLSSGTISRENSFRSGQIESL